jgi:hypothetical protein
MSTALAEEFLKRMERGEKFGDVTKDLDRVATGIGIVVKFMDICPPGTTLKPISSK